jgi:predicted AlkP superfamily pyrophosphatase or phosphodiesterase
MLALRFLLLLLVQDDKKHVVIISVDGLRPEFYLSEEFEAPTLKEFARSGAHAKGVESVYPSVTYASHASIVTGVRPAKHGVHGNTKWGENGSTQEWYWETKDLKAKPIWAAAKEKGLKTAITYWPSSVGAEAHWIIPERWAALKGESTAELLGKHSTPGLLAEVAMVNGLPKVSEIEKRKDLIDEFIAGSAAYVLGRYKPNLLLVHLIQVDDAQHEHGRDSAKVKEALKRMDANIAKIRAAAEKSGILARTVFVIVGDHGFEDVKEAVAPNTLLVEAGLIEADGRTVKSWKAIGRTFSGSMAVYAKDADSAKKAREVLEKQAGRSYTIVDRKQLDELGYDPEAVFAIEAGDGLSITATVTGKLTGQSSWAKGQHGYLPTKARMRTGFIASGAGVRKAVVEKMRVIDIAPTVAKMLRFEMKDVDGAALDILE